MIPPKGKALADDECLKGVLRACYAWGGGRTLSEKAKVRCLADWVLILTEETRTNVAVARPDLA
jgi:hypothetical protein